MKRFLWTCALSLSAVVALAEPVRVAVLDFDDKTGLKSDPLLGGAIGPGGIAEKGVYLLADKLLKSDNFALIDRRDLTAQMERLNPKDMGEKSATKPSFIHAAQVLKADVVLRGTLLSFSPRKEMVDQGGYQTDLTILSTRVALEALDAKDGTVVAMANATAEKTFRQTKEVKTVISENDVMALVEEAIAKALPPVEKALQEYQVKQKVRPSVKIAIKTTADPALVEVDGVLIGSSPLENFEVYKGDHVLTIGKPGYQEITKRILLDKDVSIEAPMFRLQLSAEELKEIAEKMQMHIFVGEPALVIRPLVP